MLGTLESLIGGAAGMAKAVNDNKAAQHQLEKMLRVTIARWKVMNYISLPTNSGQGVITKKKKLRKNIKNACGCDNKHTVGSTGKTHV